MNNFKSFLFRNFKWIFLIVYILVSFIVVKVAFGSVLYSQTTDSQNYSGGHTHKLAEGIIQLDEDLPANTITSITLRGHCDTSDEIIDIGIGPSPSYWKSGYSGGTATTTCSYGTEIHNYTFDLDIDVATGINAYRVDMNCAPEHGGNNCWVVLGTNNTGFQPRVKTPKDNYGIYQYTAPAGAKDESFYYILEGTADVGYYVDFIYPTDELETPDFSPWLLDWSITNSSESFNTGIRIIYSSDLSSCNRLGYTYSDFNNGSGCYADSSFFSVPPYSNSSFSVPKLNILSIGEYEAEAQFGGVQGVEPYASSTINFIVSSQTYWPYDPANPQTYSTSTASTTIWGLSLQSPCDSDMNWFEWGLCKIGWFLFIPNNSAMTYFSNVREALLEKVPPFSYFGVLTTELTDFSTTTPASATATGTLTIGDNSTDGTLFDFTFFTTLAGLPALQLTRNLVKAGLYLMLLGYFIVRTIEFIKSLH